MIGPRSSRGRPPSAKRGAGFTLIEVLVAVVILAIALAATTRAASMATDGALETRQRVLATWAAENRVAELRARALFPSATTTRFNVDEGGLALVVDETVTETSNPAIRRVDLAVAESRSPDRVLTRLTAYVSQ